MSSPMGTAPAATRVSHSSGACSAATTRSKPGVRRGSLRSRVTSWPPTETVRLPYGSICAAGAPSARWRRSAACGPSTESIAELSVTSSRLASSRKV